MGVLRDHHSFDADIMERSDGIAHAYDCVFRRDYQSDIDIDIDMISGVLLFRTLMGSEGKGRGKLASDREGFVTCHIGTQFCFRVYVSVFQYSVFNENLVFPHFKKVSIVIVSF
ncbi:uncharacterized protein E5676_scaffold790G001010 [Cucumis melo var. makuwa]|uniref:Uncharacterized protein n=1 Tax=Cucumis melo var. makuwa TaxID=1194695 RepID=A0A5D3CTN7_CUCMM|nr:uncharacterized protein E6C27_scaffold21G001920 [Cucumis melo var. makuwa]TYK15221.1 uncharacterized protein E5676_scaffold790G001010 [Cucumis melo var. makuwa]